MIKILSDVFEVGELRFKAGEAYEESDATRIQLAVGNGTIVADGPPAPEVHDEPAAEALESVITESVAPFVEPEPVATEVVEPEPVPEAPEAPEEKRRGRPRKHGN
jgi:hypothetical protein